MTLESSAFEPFTTSPSSIEFRSDSDWEDIAGRRIVGVNYLSPMDVRDAWEGVRLGGKAGNGRMKALEVWAMGVGFVLY